MYTYKTRVSASQIGPDGLMTANAMINAIQDCSRFWLESESVMKEYFDRRALALFLISRQVDIIRIPCFGENLDTKTGVYEINGYFGYRNTLIFDTDGKVCVKSWSTAVFVNGETGRPVRLPERVRSGLLIDARADMEYLDKRINLPVGLQCTGQPAITAMPSDIDANNHVNNAHYIRMALNLLSASSKYRRIRAEYKLAARLGDKLYPFIYNDADMRNAIVELRGENGKPFAIVEFSQPG